MTRKERKALRNRMTWLRRTRRPPAVWLQVPVILVFLAFLWWEVPRAARPVPRRPATPPPQSVAAFVELPSELAAKLLRGARMFWGTDRVKEDAAAFDIARLELDGPLPPHRHFSGGDTYPGAWKPAPVGRLRPDIPIAAPHTAGTFGGDVPLPPVRSGVRTEMDTDLSAAGFTYPVPQMDSFTAVSGAARFHVEADTNGEVETVLLLPPRTADTAGLERSLWRGHASRRCRGDLTIRWNVRRVQ
ncbi:MAG: hypothetical protein J6Z49_01705 [Kiritimatiellae bacterium]|nr:hypothetical protein [Kiritimatiellia bacterium]